MHRNDERRRSAARGATHELQVTPLAERWVHSQGCRQWFNLLRDTVTHRIVLSYRIGEAPPGRSGAP